MLRGEEVHRFPHGTLVWGEGGRSGGRSAGGDVGTHGAGVSAAGAAAAAGVVEWARRFEVDSTEGGGVGDVAEELARHLVGDGDVGLIGTRPPTLLIHGLCVRVMNGTNGHHLRIKRHHTSGEEDAERPQVSTVPFDGKDAWAAVTRQGVQGARLRVGTKKEVTSALETTFASRVGDSAFSSIAPRTLGTLNMTGDAHWEGVFVPSDLVGAACRKGGPLQLRLLVTFVEVSAKFLPYELLLLQEFDAVNTHGIESAYEWVSPDEAPEVVNSSPEPDLTCSLAQLRARLGGSWLSAAQAATVASTVPRVLAGKHYDVDVIVYLFSRVVDLHNYRQVIDTLNQRGRSQLFQRLGDLDGLCPAAVAAAAAAPTSEEPRRDSTHTLASTAPAVLPEGDTDDNNNK